MVRDVSITGRAPLEDRAAPPLKGDRAGFWFWIVFSGILHLLLIGTLFMMPHVPAPRAPAYPVYTLELVGGEKIGAEAVGPLKTSAPAEREAKKESKKAKAEPVVRAQATKEAEKKTKEKVAPSEDRIALKTSKKQTAKELQAEHELRNQLRDKRIEAAVASARGRAEQQAADQPKGEKQKQKTDAASSGSASGQGAAALGSGGGGDGVVKPLEFLVYRNRVLDSIRERWTWLGKRTDLQTVVRFSVYENGRVFAINVVRSSGDSSYDESVIQAVQKASPLPTPPEAYRSEFKDWEIKFCPKENDPCA